MPGLRVSRKVRRTLSISLAAVGLSAALNLATAAPASAGVHRNDNDVTIYHNDHDVSCMGWTENKNPDSGNSDIRAGFRVSANSGASCQGWLERKRFNPDGTVKYNWTRVSDYVWYQDGDSWRFTGYHWNGTDAGSRVCVRLTDTGEQGCSYGVW